MNILFAPDSYGGFFTAPAACAHLRRRLGAGANLRTHPMADGGEGTLAALASHHPVQARGLHVDGVDAVVARFEAADYVESAQVIGRGAFSADLGTAERSSERLGALICRAGDEGPLMVGLGGSATVDGGLGMALGLGLSALDGQGRSTDRLAEVRRLVGRPAVRDRVVVALSDVRSPLAEAAVRFGPQKGVQPAEVAPLTDALARWADVLDAWRGETGRPPVPRDLPGGGAAGGVGYALAAVLDAALLPGADTFARITNLDAALDGCEVVVLGEGRLDATSFQGKVAETVSRGARRRGAQVVALVGLADGVPPPPEGPDRIFVAGAPTTDAFDAAIDRLGAWLTG